MQEEKSSLIYMPRDLCCFALKSTDSLSLNYRNLMIMLLGFPYALGPVYSGPMCLLQNQFHTLLHRTDAHDKYLQPIPNPMIFSILQHIAETCVILVDLPK